MTLLELITKASADLNTLASESAYPIILNPDDILLNMKPQIENANPISLVNPLTGWQISQTDSQLIDLGNKFFKKLKRNLKNPIDFNKDEFVAILNPFLEKLREKVGISIQVDSSYYGYTRVLIEKVGFVMGNDVVGLLLEACVGFEIWELVECMIINRLVGHSHYSNLVENLVAKRRSYLLCLCIKHASNLGSSTLLYILKYFLCPPKDAYANMVSVRKEWESQALLAIEKASNNNIKGKKLRAAKEASILLMIAYDGFSASELCLHYFLASPNLDEVILSSTISKLNGKEMMYLIRYLEKWLKKYERFPQVCPCPKASSMLGLKACEWVPKLEHVVKCLGLVLDENFSSLVMHPEYHEELRSIEGVGSNLTIEAAARRGWSQHLQFLVPEFVFRCDSGFMEIDGEMNIKHSSSIQIFLSGNHSSQSATSVICNSKIAVFWLRRRI